VLADRSLISPGKLCQSLTNTEPTIAQSTGTPMEELEKAEGVCSPIGRTTISTNQTPPELPGTKPPTKEYAWSDPWLPLHMLQRIDINERRGPWSCECLMFQCRGMQGMVMGVDVCWSTLIEKGGGGGIVCFWRVNQERG
jgi:hypothetical protein